MDVILQLFEGLESNNPSIAEEAKKTFHEYFNSTKETWLVNGLFDYYINTGSMKAVEILISIREPHDRYLCDRIFDTVRGQQHKFQALTLLGYVVKRHPTWLYKITHHPLLKELLRLLKTETDILSLMSALLIVVILLPIIAGLFGPYLQDIFEVFSRLAAWNTNNPNKFPEGHLLHLQIGLYALFNRLYGMYPCNFLSYLRNQYTMKENFPIFTHTIKPMLDTVKIHPLLVTASKEAEIATARWKKMEANDVIMECAKFTVDWGNDKLHDDCGFRARTSSFRSRPSLDYCGNSFGLNKLESSTNGIPVVGPFSANLSDTDVWSPASHTGAITPTDSTVPLTPMSQSYLASSTIPQGTDGNSPPEAAVEATPESTPIKELREPDLRVPPGSGAVRALNSFNVGGGGHSQPSSPIKKDSSFFQFPPQSPLDSSAFQSTVIRPKDNNLMLQKVQRLVLDRMQVVETKEPSNLQSGLLRGVSGYQPSSPLRVISSPPIWSDHSNPNSPHPSNVDHTDEDREVESTMRTDAPPTSLFKRMESVSQETCLPESGTSTVTSGGASGGGEDFEDITVIGAQGCIQGGLHMPDSHQMMKFAHQFSRMRFYSQCQSETVTQQMGESSSSSSPKETTNIFIDVNVRRAISCPEMKKATSGFGGFSDLGVAALAETEEEVDDLSVPSVGGQPGLETKEVKPKLISNSTQTDDPPTYEPMGYEHLFLPVFPIIQQGQPTNTVTSGEVYIPATNDLHQISSPHSALQHFIDTTVKNLSERVARSSDGLGDDKVIREQLTLLSLQLQYERHRREVHAERNRRLLGKSRNNRALEEHNLALKDQVSLMQKEIEMLRKELERSKFLGKSQIDQVQQSLDYWQDQSTVLQRDCKAANAKVVQLEIELKDEKSRLAAIAKEYSETQAEVFKLEKSLHQAVAMASAGREVKNELSHLQHQLAAAGEIEASLKSRYATLALRSQQETEALMMKQSYSYSQSASQQSLDLKQSLLDAAQLRISELQALVDQKDSILEEQKDLYLKSKVDHNKKIKELEKKCEDLRKLNNHQGQQTLELQHTVEKLKAEANTTSGKSKPLSPPPLRLEGSEGLISGLESPHLWNLQLLVERSEARASSDDQPVSSLQM